MITRPGRDGPSPVSASNRVERDGHLSSEIDESYLGPFLLPNPWPVGERQHSGKMGKYS
jgi:hypothetical protein